MGDTKPKRYIFFGVISTKKGIAGEIQQTKNGPGLF
jgi:hypothetical protein